MKLAWLEKYSERLLRGVFAFVTIAPWSMWFELNALALRFVQLRGNWPMCRTALPCYPDAFYASDSMDTLSDDPILRLLDLQGVMVLFSPPVWFVLWFVVGKHLSRVARRVFLAAFIVVWALLIVDPTGVWRWWMD